MDILKPSMALTVFQMLGDFPPDWDDAYQQLANNKAGVLDSVQPDQKQLGWSTGRDVLSCDFNDETCRCGDYYLLHLRAAERKASSKLMAAAVERKVELWKKQTDSSRVPRKIRRDIQAEVADELSHKALPTLTWIQVIVVPAERRVYALNFSSASSDTLIVQFYKTFGVELEQLTPWGWAKALDTNVPPPDGIGREFLTWCLWQGEVWKLDGDPAFYVADPIELYYDDEHQDEARVSTTVAAKGYGAPVCDELQAALLGGKTLSKAMLRIAPNHEDLWEGRFEANRMVWSGLKLPKEEGDTDDERIGERIQAIAEMIKLVHDRFADFWRDYQKPDYSERRRAWINGRARHE